MRSNFTDEVAKQAALEEADKRNKHKSKHLRHMAWKALWDNVRGWHVTFAPVSKETIA